MKKLFLLMSLLLIQVCKPVAKYTPAERWSPEKITQVFQDVWEKDATIKSIFKAACGTELVEEIMNSSNYPVEENYEQTCPLVKKFLEIKIDQLREHFENQERKQKRIDRLNQELVIAENDFFNEYNQHIQQLIELIKHDQFEQELTHFIQKLNGPVEIVEEEDRYNTTDGTH